MVLTLVISLCLALAIRPTPALAVSRAQRYLLTIFFAMTALTALDNLLFWGDAIKYAAFNFSPWLPMVFSFASFVVGPLLYWLMRSEISPDFRIRQRHYWQLLPALVTPVYLYWACYRHPLEQQWDLVLEFSIFSAPHAYFFTFLTLKKLIPFFYGALCVNLLLRKMPRLSERSPETARILWLYAGFALIWLWGLLTHILGQWLPIAAADFMGIFGNYLSLGLVATLLFSSVGTQPSKTEINIETVAKPVEESGHADAEALAARIDKLMQTEKPYLNSQLTLERFADLLGVSSRQVSFTINRCFQQNFHEFINRFRVEEAKRLLGDEEFQERTILDIAQQSGFNSKATFNRFFKSFVGVTPSAYRQQISAGMTPQHPHWG